MAPMYRSTQHTMIGRARRAATRRCCSSRDGSVSILQARPLAWALAALCSCTGAAPAPSPTGATTRAGVGVCRAWATPAGPAAECSGGARWAAFALCVPVPEPDRVGPIELRGRVPLDDPSQWSPNCAADLVVPCEAGTHCDARGCTCACDRERGDGDCRAAVLGAEAGGAPAGLASTCELLEDVDTRGRCVWGRP